MRAVLTILIASLAASGSTSGAVKEAPFSLSIAAPSTVQVGSNFNIDITITNVSSTPITLSRGNPAIEYDFDVKDSRGQQVAETATHKRIRDTSKSSVIYRLTRLVLEPGKSSHQRVNLSDYYDLRLPGKYSVQLQRMVPERLGGGMVHSNTIEFTVVR
jgi:hypothetical protein